MVKKKTALAREEFGCEWVEDKRGSVITMEWDMKTG